MSEDRRVHLDEWSLQAYLDDGLQQAEREKIDAHRLDCEDCAAAFAAMEDLFLELACLPEEPLTNDLSARVLRSIALGEGRKFNWTWVLAGQCAAAIALIFTLWRRFSLELGAWMSPAQLFEPLWQFIEFSVEGDVIFRNFLTRIYSRSVAELSMPAIDLPVSSLALTTIVAALILIWILGNGILLRKPSNGHVRQK